VGRLTTHVLDLARGRPAAGLTVELWRADEPAEHLVSRTTNGDGRTDAPLLEGAVLTPGRYRLVFHAGDYLVAAGLAADFLDRVPIEFRIVDEGQHYHVPLLLSSFGYSTYRGS
jgi:5-hydroxyisourate hydrolase